MRLQASPIAITHTDTSSLEYGSPMEYKWRNEFFQTGINVKIFFTNQFIRNSENISSETLLDVSSQFLVAHFYSQGDLLNKSKLTNNENNPQAYICWTSNSSSSILFFEMWQIERLRILDGFGVTSQMWPWVSGMLSRLLFAVSCRVGDQAIDRGTKKADKLTVRNERRQWRS